ncbi:nicotinate phosphoribosyltransferase [Trichophyton soudanense CBS 452.61]|nr:nicotinate phosphoribosyltransferase [Trichophyton soudanense CBS 452.61]
MGDVKIAIKGLWVETILYEIPLLALTSETYFKFCDRDWDYHQQEEKAFRKGCALLENGCIFSEFGTRRRRDYHTQNLVMEGLTRAAKKGVEEGFKGKFAGTSNVHFAMKYGIDPVGTVAHEWYMGIAAITNNYENANEIALRYWLGCFGEGVSLSLSLFFFSFRGIAVAVDANSMLQVLGIALTDTFGTPTFLESFGKPVPELTSAEEGPEATMPSSGINTSETDSLTSTVPPIQKPFESAARNTTTKTYAQVFTGVRQDSGDPIYFLKMAKDFYEKEGIKDKKTVVFSDSLNIELCLEYKVIAEESGFQPTFGVGTFFTNDFNRTSNGKKSVPLNIVIKVSSAGGRPAVKLSDNLGKNTGDPKTVVEVKKRLGYVEHDWEDGDETRRWGKKED